MVSLSNVQTVVPFVDLNAQYQSIRNEIRSELDKVFESTQFVLGNAVEEFERDFAAFIGAKHAIGVGCGLDALRLALEAAGVGAGDEVIIPANTFIATALAVSATGAKPVLVDCLEATYQIDPALIEPAITPRSKVIMPVHLYGQAADIKTIVEIARNHRLEVIEDAAQAHGTRFLGQRCGTFGLAGCFSFYPGKNLGAYGDGGAIVTNDDEFAKKLNSLRNYGQKQKYVHVEKGTNSRLDTVQAAILNVKLGYLDGWNAARRAHAALYSDCLADDFIVPALDSRSEHIFHLYVLRARNRDELQKHLSSRGIQTGIHYPIPIHLQEAYRDLGLGRGSFPVTEKLADEIVSLPMFPELSHHQIELVLEALSSLTTERLG